LDVFSRLRINVNGPCSPQIVTFITELADKLIDMESDTATDETRSQCLEILITSMTTSSQELTFIQILNPDDHSIDVLTASIAAIIGNLSVIKAIFEDSNLNDPLARIHSLGLLEDVVTDQTLIFVAAAVWFVRLV
jgi:hypothetical protein